jgi:pyridoxamine 5'-phosphate oxidase
MSEDRVWVGNIRREYGAKQLRREDLDADPIRQFKIWFEEGSSTVLEPNAMALATADHSGRPSLRMVLMKAFDHRGFVFGTSYVSRKSEEISENGAAALLFYWPELERQVRVTGEMERTSDEESDEIFLGRSPKSRIAARAVRQSDPIENRAELERAFAAEEKRWEGNDNVLRPETWGGYRLKPIEFEFWQGGRDRLHDRLVYTICEKEWEIERLQP